MTRELILRAAAAVAAFALARRMSRRSAALGAGLLAGFAVLGPRLFAMPGAAEAAEGALFTVTLLALAGARAWPSPVGDGAAAGASAALGAACAAAWAVRGLQGWQGPAAIALAVAAVSAFSAEATRASAEAGWREVLAWVSAVSLPVLLAAGFAGLFRGVPRHAEPAVVFGLLVAAILVWLPAIFSERARVGRELVEEVTLGLLSEEDAVALRLPWTRGFEKRFGRPDERRQYVKSALLLAVARHQQRHRTGEAERLRQLEVLTFRTRLRRTQDARASRFSRSDSGEFGETQVRDTPERPGTL